MRTTPWLVLLAAAPLLLPLACADGEDDRTPPACHAPDAAGPYAAGMMELSIEDPLRDEPFQAHVAYPAVAAGADAQPDRGGAPYPLVIFSHGMLMYPATYDYLFEHLASHGFVVLGTKHQDSAEFAVAKVKHACETIPEAEQYGKIAEVFGSLFEEDHPLRRPADVTHLIDAAATLNRSDPSLTGMVDLSRVGAVGHSFGGFTSLLVGGAAVDRALIQDMCKDGPDMWLLDLMGGESLKALMCFLFDSVSEQSMSQPFDVLDARVKTVTSIAGPVEWIWSTDFSGLGQVELPVLMVYTTTDESVKYQEGAVPAYGAFDAPKYFLTVDGGTHGNFGYIDSTVFDALVAEIPEGCVYNQFVESMVNTSQVPTLDAADQMRLTRVPIAAFLQHHLAGATGCEPFLVPSYYENDDADVQEFQASAP